MTAIVGGTFGILQSPLGMHAAQRHLPLGRGFDLFGRGSWILRRRCPRLVAGLVIAVWGAETTQIWWISLNGLDAIALALMCKGLPRATRPPVPLSESGPHAPGADANFEDRNFAD